MKELKILEKLFDVNKIPTKLIIVALISSSLMLFVPEQFLIKLNIDEISQDYGKFIGITFVISAGFSVVSLWVYFANRCKKVMTSKNIKKRIIRDVKNLNFHEQSLLREFYIARKTTLPLPIDDETVIGLENKRIIYRASDMCFDTLCGYRLSFTVSKTAQEYLNDELLGISENITKEDILRNRPKWAQEQSKMEEIHDKFGKPI